MVCIHTLEFELKTLNKTTFTKTSSTSSCSSCWANALAITVCFDKQSNIQTDTIGNWSPVSRKKYKPQDIHSALVQRKWILHNCGNKVDHKIKLAPIDLACAACNYKRL